jgi:hypothetical protein
VQVQLGDGKWTTQSCGVRPPAGESDQSTLSDGRWGELGNALGFERIEPGRESIAGVVAGARSGHELWLTVIAAVIVLSLVELAVVRRWTGEGT